ncbi:MAG TPA: YdcF family protein [Pseudolabrys sp.]|nr:YdcF family protein [Pseudolabrys sp.]
MISRIVSIVGFATIVLFGAVTALLVAGFFWFVTHVPEQQDVPPAKADGIVVLTGAAARIPDAIELLATGHGRRLLITGVHRATSAGEIAQLTPVYQKVFDCCVDLDRSALNTLGNATETRRWVRERGFRSIIVVTSNWHMPRAMAELEHQLPDITLIPFPVATAKIKNEPWWSSASTLRLLLAEYLKYAFAVVRMRIDPDFP